METTFFCDPNIPKYLPTTWPGVWERNMIDTYMIWIIVPAKYSYGQKYYPTGTLVEIVITNA